MYVEEVFLDALEPSLLTYWLILHRGVTPDCRHYLKQLRFGNSADSVFIIQITDHVSLTAAVASAWLEGQLLSFGFFLPLAFFDLIGPQSDKERLLQLDVRDSEALYADEPDSAILVLDPIRNETLEFELSSFLDEVKELVAILFEPFDVSSILNNMSELVHIDDVVEPAPLKLGQCLIGCIVAEFMGWIHEWSCLWSRVNVTL